MNARTTPHAAALLPGAVRRPPARERRGASSSPAAPAGRRVTLSRPGVPGRRRFPPPASLSSPSAPHGTPVPETAHSAPRAIRAHRSPR